MYLVACEGQRLLELSPQPAFLRHGYLPDAEETQHMVNAVGVKVAGHIAEPPFPPMAAVAQHLIPVVGRESPVLSIHGEVIGWGTGLTVEVEVARLLPHVASVAIHADGDITF